jgi:hypothetical protein
MAKGIYDTSAAAAELRRDIKTLTNSLRISKSMTKQLYDSVEAAKKNLQRRNKAYGGANRQNPKHLVNKYY